MDHQDQFMPEAEVEAMRTPSISSGSEAATPVPHKFADDNSPTPTDSMVSISLTEDLDRKSNISQYSVENFPEDVVSEVLRRASWSNPSIHSVHSIDDLVDTPGAETRLVEEIATEKARSRSTSLATTSDRGQSRERSDSSGSDTSLHVDWESLDKTEQKQEQVQEVDETTLLLARLEQENNAIATDPKSGTKTRGMSQSRPPSIYQLKKLVHEQGARSVRFSLLPAAAPMTELDFWAALVRDYPQTAQRLPTITSNKIRSGIPAPLRGVVWVSMAGARDKAIEERYDKLCGESSPYEKMIGKDIGRSFPGHEMFRDPEGEGQRMLGSVLKCYSLYDDKIGYCQGLGFLVGPLLMNMGDREAFCVLVRLMEDYDLRSCFLPDLSGLHLRIYQFNRLLHQHVPAVAAHLDALGMEGEYLSQWFLSFFAVTCPLPLLFRIYDVIFAEGASETMMRVALSIMQRNEKKILGYAEFEDVMQLLLSRQLWDAYGLNVASADEFVLDFVGFTSLVTRESLDALELNFREAQTGETGGRLSFLPNVSKAASGFLGRLWTSSPKSQGLAPGNTTQGPSRPSSTLLRTPSKQSLSTLGSLEGSSISSASSGSTASTAMTDISRESYADSGSIKSIKSPTDSMANLGRGQPLKTKEMELDGQIEDLLTVLSEMQRNQALLAAQLQKVQEERSEDTIVVQSLVNQIKVDMFAPLQSLKNRRRAASEVGKSQDAALPTLSATTLRLLDSLDNRLSASHNRRSSGIETKLDLRTTLATVREQLHAESTRAQELGRELEVKDQEVSCLREEIQKGRNRIKDSHFDKQRLEKTVIDLRQELRESQRRQNAISTSSLSLSRSNSKSSTDARGEDPETRDADQSASKPGGLRELRLGRTLTRTNSNGPTQVFTKRTSSLLHTLTTNTSSAEMLPIPGTPSSPRHAVAASVPTTSAASADPDNDYLLLELANAKTAEAMARQELEELRARFDAMRKMMAPTVTPPAFHQTDPMGGGPVSAQTMPLVRTPQSSSASTAPSTATPASSTSAFGFFGWGKR